MIIYVYIFLIKYLLFRLENEAILKNCPLSIAELAGMEGKRATCLSTRGHSSSEQKPANVINGDDFVTVQNSSGSCKFDLKLLKEILSRFKPDFFIGPFDEHSIPMSLKRVRRAVDRNLKYEKISESASDEFPFFSSISGAEYLTEKERNISGISLKSSGIAFCDLQKLPSVEEGVALVSGTVSGEGREGLCRIVRGSVSPDEMIRFLPFVDIFDTTFVDDLTAKGQALQINDGKVEESLNLWDEKYFEDFSPIMKGCDCLACKNYKRSYLHHLLKSHEMLSGVLLMMHNLRQYYHWLEYLKSTV